MITVSKKLVWYTIGFIVVLLIAGYIMTDKYFTKVRELSTQSAVLQQNAAAFQSQLTQKADSIQILAIQVVNLNTKIAKDSGRYIALQGQTALIIDSLRKSGKGIAISGKDSIGDYIQAPFSGKEGIANYSGFTKSYPMLNPMLSFYSISLDFDTIFTFSDLVQDKDNIWRIRTYTTAPGIKLLAKFNIDSALFVGQKTFVDGKLEEASRAIPSFGLRLKGNLGIASDNIKGTQFNGVFVDASAEAYYKHWNVTYYPFSKVISGGLILNLDIGKWLSKIF